VTARLIEGEVAEDACVGVIVPATTRPTRKATVAERHTLTARNRRVIVFYYCIEVRLNRFWLLCLVTWALYWFPVRQSRR